MKNKIKKILAVACVTIVGGALTVFGLYGFICVIPERAKGIPLSAWFQGGVIVVTGLGIMWAFQWSLIYLLEHRKG